MTFTPTNPVDGSCNRDVCSVQCVCVADLQHLVYIDHRSETYSFRAGSWWCDFAEPSRNIYMKVMAQFSIGRFKVWRSPVHKAARDVIKHLEIDSIPDKFWTVWEIPGAWRVKFCDPCAWGPRGGCTQRLSTSPCFFTLRKQQRSFSRLVSQ